MNSFQRAIVTNNHGVKLLESDDTLLAIAAFQGGIQLIKDYGDACNMNQKLTSDVQNGQSFEPEYCPSIATNDSFGLPHIPLTTTDFQQGLYYSYDRPILLPSNLLTSSPQVLQSKLYLISAILLFNLALTFQKHANQNCTSSTMLRVVRVYTLAGTVLEQGCCNDDWGKFMMCLIFNNLANLYYELCDYDASHYLFSRIKQSVSNDVAINDFATSFLTEDEWMEVQLNCVYSQIPSAASSA
jgi:hypothetical protein